MATPAAKTVAILEARTGAHLAELIARQGAVPLLAPALEELADVMISRAERKITNKNVHVRILL